jgi:hypothetical protein
MAISTLELHRLYLAYFGRPADAGGIDFYLDPHSNWTIFSDGAEVTVGFSQSPESQALYGPEFGVEQIRMIYRNLFGREAEQDGIDYWLAKVQSGEIQPAGAAYAILVGARNEDLLAVNNKLAMCQEFFAAMGSPEGRDAYAGDEAALLARGFIDAVGADPATLERARADLQAKVAEIMDPPTEAKVFTLTDKADTFRGTRFDDTFIGVLGEGETFSVLDDLDGGAGLDTLELTIRAGLRAQLSEPGVTRNIEYIHLTNAAGSAQQVDATLFRASARLFSKDSADALEFVNLRTGTAVGYIGNAEADLTFRYAQSAENANLVMGEGRAGRVEIGGNDVRSTSIGGPDWLINVPKIYEIDELVLAGADNAMLSIGGGQKYNQITLHDIVSEDAQDVRITMHGLGIVNIGALHGSFAGYEAVDSMAHVEIFSDEGGDFNEAFTYEGGGGIDTYHVRGRLTTGRAEGGDGANGGGDMLVVHGSDLLGDGSRYSGFERIAVVDGVHLDLAEVDTDFERVVIQDGDSEAGTRVTGLSTQEAADVVITAVNRTGQLAIGLAGNAGRLHVTLSGSEAELDLGDLTLDNVAELEVASDLDYGITSFFNIGPLLTYTGSGAGNVDMQLSGASLGGGDDVAQRRFDFSALTGRLTLRADQSQQSDGTSGFLISDGANADSIVGSRHRDTVTYQGNADTIQLYVGGDEFYFNNKSGSGTMKAGVTLSVSAAESCLVDADTGAAFDRQVHFDETVADSITGVRSGQTFNATQGTRFTIDTGVDGAGFEVAQEAIVFGTGGAVAALGFVMEVHDNAAYIMQDTNGNSAIDDGEFLVRIIGDGSFTEADFSINGAGQLVFESRA